jgi:hypothetical protein
VSEVTETANLASSYCPRCDPERDPSREILTVRWCHEHQPTCEGADDERANVGRVALGSAGEANADTNRPWCELVHRAGRSKPPGSRGETHRMGTTLVSGVARGVAVGALAVVLTLDASIQEFAELVSLSDDARRERFHLPPACAPIISAVKPAVPNSSRLTVFVECSTPTTAPPSPIEPTSWTNESVTGPVS